ncbi:UNVERIFIED_CONTAM: hypothetical protein GTU68_012081 [Idotea baltica]|nr:hypothetical protein [Idotea baltica]
MKTYYAAITGVGGYVPESVLSNKDLEALVNTNDEWITSRTGIKERRILTTKGLGTSDMGMHAVNELLQKTNTDPSEIDLLICCTVTPDMQFPATANIIADKTGIVNIPSFDVNAACSGFLYGLSTASQFIKTGQAKKVIVVGADKMSSIVDYEDRATCVIFGDGAGAIMLEPTEEPFGILDFLMKSDGSGRKFLHQKAGGSVKPASFETDGKNVFKFAVTNMADISAEIMERNNLIADDIAWLVPHQANKRIIDATAKRMGLSEDKVMLNIQKFGNTTDATIPLCLWEWEKQLQKGDKLILAAFGGGFTWASVYLQWAYNS